MGGNRIYIYLGLMMGCMRSGDLGIEEVGYEMLRLGGKCGTIYYVFMIMG